MKLRVTLTAIIEVDVNLTDIGNGQPISEAQAIADAKELAIEDPGEFADSAREVHVTVEKVT